MNSLNRIAARVSPSQTPSPSRTSSFGNVLSLPGHSEARRSSRDGASIEKGTEELLPIETPHEGDGTEDLVDEKTPLLVNDPTTSTDLKPFESRSAPDRIIRAIMNSLRWVVSTLTAPAVYLIAFLYDDRGRFAPFSRGPEFGPGGYNGRPLAHATNVLPSGDDHSLQGNHATGELSGRRSSVRPTRRPLSSSSSSGLSSESESEHPTGEQDKELTSSTARHTRSKSLQNSDEIAPARRSIRIKLHADDSVRQRRHRKAQSTSSPAGPSISPEALKSPTSPAISAMTKYPRAPAPPRPLIPRRQPSYSIADASNGKLAQKTLVLDLDETLIHSIAKGGRMSTGHMVEVRLNTVMGDNIGPQHPILYYVNKRPHCDDFLRSICKWYNLVIFTASVQEYADPVIDYLERERKFFSGRYYRQHCTYRNGAFIKDLGAVEPDLSKVMILDNSPLSYMFHQDNAIPIEGWISDPTDNHLLHLVPLLEGLQYVTDVRALLALRGGEDGKHMQA